MNRFLELGLTADLKGVNVVNDSGTWNLSIHFSSQSLEPLICLKSGNILITWDGSHRASTLSEKDGDFSEILKTCSKGNQTIEISFNGKYKEGTEDFFGEIYPTLLEKHGAPEPKGETLELPTVAGPKGQERKSSDWSTTAWVLGGLAFLLLLGIGYSYRQSLGEINGSS